MRVCKVDYLTGTEVLARDVFTPEYQILLSEGTFLKQEYIEKLKELEIKEVYIEERESDTKTVVILKKEIEDSFRIKVRDILEKYTYRHNEKLEELSQTADRIINNILKEEKVVEQIYDIKGRSSDIYEHSISICSLSTIVALKMNLPYETVHDIGVGCLLHDLGLRYLPVMYTDRNMILYHHECLDGSGYPLKATEIPEECRIIQICDTFDEMICGIGCKRTKVYEAVEYLKNFKDVKFDGKIVDIFLEFTAVFPAGSTVRTNEGEIGIVLYQNNKFPNRPVLRIIKDKDGNSVNIVKDLIKVNNIYIEKVID